MNSNEHEMSDNSVEILNVDAPEIIVDLVEAGKPECKPCSEYEVDDSTMINNISVPFCVDIYTEPARDVVLQGAGRILKLRLNIKNVCPGKRVAVAVRLFEVNRSGSTANRGLKTYVVRHNDTRCRDICITNISFVLPECLDISSCSDFSIDPEEDMAGNTCNARKLRAEVIAHYVDVRNF